MLKKKGAGNLLPAGRDVYRGLKLFVKMQALQVARAYAQKFGANPQQVFALGRYGAVGGLVFFWAT